MFMECSMHCVVDFVAEICSTHVMPSGTWEDIGLTDSEYRDSLVSLSHLRLTIPWKKCLCRVEITFSLKLLSQKSLPLHTRWEIGSVKSSCNVYQYVSFGIFTVNVRHMIGDVKSTWNVPQEIDIYEIHLNFFGRQILPHSPLLGTTPSTG